MYVRPARTPNIVVATCDVVEILVWTPCLYPRSGTGFDNHTLTGTDGDQLHCPIHSIVVATNETATRHFCCCTTVAFIKTVLNQEPVPNCNVSVYTLWIYFIHNVRCFCILLFQSRPMLSTSIIGLTQLYDHPAVIEILIEHWICLWGELHKMDFEHTGTMSGIPGRSTYSTTTPITIWLYDDIKPMVLQSISEYCSAWDWCLPARGPQLLLQCITRIKNTAFCSFVLPWYCYVSHI